MDLLYIVIIIGSVIAIVTIIKNTVISQLYDASDVASYFTVVPACQAETSVEFVVKSILWHKNWEKYNGCHIFLVVDNCSEETIEICERLNEQYQSVLLCYSDQLAKIVREYDFV